MKSIIKYNHHNNKSIIVVNYDRELKSCMYEIWSFSSFSSVIFHIFFIRNLFFIIFYIFELSDEMKSNEISIFRKSWVLSEYWPNQKIWENEINYKNQKIKMNYILPLKYSIFPNYWSFNDSKYEFYDSMIFFITHPISTS